MRRRSWPARPPGASAMEPIMAPRCLFVCATLLLVSGTAATQLSPLEQLGKRLYFDTNLSNPPGQACASCHAPGAAFAGPTSAINELGGIYPGAVHVRAGNRRAPTAAYAGDSPPLHYDAGHGWIGGMFWDGRATGWVLGDPLAEQAMGPFLNPLEHNMPQMRLVVRRIALSDYADLFRQVWGPDSLDPVKDVAGSYERIARSIAAFERSPEVNPFDSKYDYFLAGQATLTTQEMLGLEVFEGKGKCSSCHLSRPGPNNEPPLFTDFEYYNVGTPRNPANPFYNAPRPVNPDGAAWVDPGLGGFLKNAGYEPSAYMPEMGKHKVPTLRNVDQRPHAAFVRAYLHNGVFNDLETLVHFYNTRDVGSWPPPEVPQNINTTMMGNLGLTPAEEEALIAFLKTLTDGYQP
jgi:cytochrome c peroxidase